MGMAYLEEGESTMRMLETQVQKACPSPGFRPVGTATKAAEKGPAAEYNAQRMFAEVLPQSSPRAPR